MWCGKVAGGGTSCVVRQQAWPPPPLLPTPKSGNPAARLPYRCCTALPLEPGASLDPTTATFGRACTATTALLGASAKRDFRLTGMAWRAPRGSCPRKRRRPSLQLRFGSKFWQVLQTALNQNRSRFRPVSAYRFFFFFFGAGVAAGVDSPSVFVPSAFVPSVFALAGVALTALTVIDFRSGSKFGKNASIV